MHLADDTGYNASMAGTFLTVATAAANQAFRGIAVIPTDADADGIPDWWELGYFGSLSASDGTGDFDHNGVSDLEEYWAGTDPTDAEDFMRLIDLNLSESDADDVVITFHGGRERTFAILAADVPDAAGTVIGSVKSGDMSGSYTFIDVDAVSAATVAGRYYTIAAMHEDGSYTNSAYLMLHVQARAPQTRSLVCIPVDYGEGENGLQGRLGTHLMRGLSPAITAEIADEIQFQDAAGAWQVRFLFDDGEGGLFWGDDFGFPAEDIVKPGMGFWVVRKSGETEHDNAAFLGEPFSAGRVTNFVFKAGAWTTFGWPLPGARRHVGEVALSNQLGFAENGKGTASTKPWEAFATGDQIWVWKHNTWIAYYILLDGIGPGWDGRWWDFNKGRFADIELLPGMAYYYWHAPGGEGFVWTPSLPDE